MSSDAVDISAPFDADTAATILAALPHPIAMFDRNGDVAAANDAWRQAPAAIRGAAIDAVRAWLAAPPHADDGGVFTRSLLTEPGDSAYDLTATRVAAAARGLGAAATGAGAGLADVESAAVIALHPVGSSRRLQEKLATIDAAGRELVKLDADSSSRLSVPERLGILETKIVRFCSDLMHFSHFAVRILDQTTGRLDTVLAGGFPEEARNLEIFAQREGHGISGFVAASGEAVLCSDVSQDPRYLPGISGARSSLTVPLRLHDTVVGILNVESEQLNAFTEEDRQIAEIFGRYIAVALHMLKLLVVERAQVTDQLAADLANELVEPLDRILADAAILMESGGATDVVGRARAIIRQVDLAKRAIHDVMHPPPIKGLAGAPSEFDPLLEGLSVLIADDEPTIRDTIAAVLAKAGAMTVTVSDGNEAIRLLRTQLFDLVLSDIKMPSKNGYEVFAVAKAANARTPVILITGFGYDPDHQIVRASKEGLGGVLFKPFEVAKLMEVVHQSLQASE